jgi:hypothetical protein
VRFQGVLDGELVQPELGGQLVKLFLRRAGEIDPHDGLRIHEVFGHIGHREPLRLEDPLPVHPRHEFTHRYGPSRAPARGRSLYAALSTRPIRYEDFYDVWPKRTDNPFTPVLNASQKYVASRTLEDPLPWENSILLGRDVPAAIAELKESVDRTS